MQRPKDYRPLTSAEAAARLQEFGPNTIEDKHTPPILVFLRMLVQPLAILIWLAAAAEAAIENWPDMAILLAILFTNAIISFVETLKAGNAVAELQKGLKPSAHVNRDGKWMVISASQLVPGDLVRLGPGMSIPADCVVHEGELEIDNSGITGESVPVLLGAGETILMGASVVRFEALCIVSETGMRTFYGKTASMLESSGSGAPGDTRSQRTSLESLLLKITLSMVVFSFALCFTCLAYLLAAGEDWRSALSFTVVLIVASIPIGIMVVCTVVLALGSRYCTASHRTAPHSTALLTAPDEAAVSWRLRCCASLVVSALFRLALLRCRLFLCIVPRCEQLSSMQRHVDVKTTCKSTCTGRPHAHAHLRMHTRTLPAARVAPDPASSLRTVRSWCS